jgi:hypothetical protein
MNTDILGFAPSSPREERAGRGWRRGEFPINAPPLPGPLLHFAEEREKNGLPGNF